MPDFNNYVYFVLERNSNASYSFTGYTDPETGEIKAYYIGRKDPKTGENLPHRFKFDKAHRSMRVGKHERDINGVKKVDFLRNFPECAGSKNGSYSGDKQSNVWFRELNVKKDAEIAIEAKSEKIRAESLALSLEGEELKHMSILCGEHSDDDGLQKHRVLEAAGANPSKFMALYNLPERSAKVLLAKALKEGIIKQRGSLYIWEEVTVGTSEDSAIAKLISDKQLAKAIEDNMSVAPEPKVAAPKKVAPKKKEEE